MTGIVALWRGIELDEEVNTLRSTLERLTALESDKLVEVKNAEIQPGKKRRREVEVWFTNVKKKKSEFQLIETELREDGPSKSLKSHIEKETKEVEELIQQGQFPKGVVLDDHASTRLPLVTTSLVGQSCLDNIESILKWLKNDDVFGIGIHGMGGVGKTTLLKQIHNKLLDDSDIKGQVYWVTASQECSLEKLQIDIGKAIGIDLRNEGAERRKALLFRRFSDLGKSVLILDDLWKHYPAEQVGIPLEMCGCKIILTTRSLDVCRRMACQEIIKIVPLSSSDAWKLFVENVGEVAGEVNAVAEEVVEECGGLPLALITMGRCMRGMVDVHDWNNALHELRKPVSCQEFMKDDVYRTLKFSFDSLKDEKVQSCFLSCVLFPEDFDISGDTLVDLWMNEGLLDEAESRQDRLSKGHAMLNRLVNSCLLESTSDCRGKKSVKMHDLIRDMAMIITQSHCCSMAKSGIRLKEFPEEKQWSRDLVRASLSYNCIMEIPEWMAPMTLKLSVLFLNNNNLYGMPESFFDHMRALTVLDLSGTNIERVAGSVSNLENLRALLLGHCIRLTYVPSLARLTSLRVLDLTNTFSLKEGPKGLEELKQLEKVLECPWNVSDINGFNKLIRFSPSLSCYMFFLTPSYWDDDGVEWDLFEEYDRLVYIGGAEMGENETMLLPTSIQALVIYESEMKGKRILTAVFPSLAGAAHLEKMYLQECRGFEYIASSSSSSWCLQLETLESLNLVNLPELRRIVEYGGCSFLRLRRLRIINCPKIKVVFPLTLTKQQLNLPHLVRIEVSECEEVEQIFESNHDIQPYPLISLPKLKYITLRNLPKLGSIYRGLLLCNKMYLDVHGCPNVKTLEESEGSERVICDASFTTLRSIASHPEFWETFNRNWPLLAPRISYQINQLLRWDSSPAVADDDKDEESKWVECNPTHQRQPRLSIPLDRSDWGASLSLLPTTP